MSMRVESANALAPPLAVEVGAGKGRTVAATDEPRPMAGDTVRVVSDTTAVGLLAAIPAAIGYNGLGRMSKRIVTDLDGFGLELLNLVRRQQVRVPVLPI